MTGNRLFKDAASWWVQVLFAVEDATYAQKWKPETFIQRVSELQWTRRQFAVARERALTAGIPGTWLDFPTPVR